MKLTDGQKLLLKETAKGRDWETYHQLYDEMMKDRLFTLDPDFVRDLDEVAPDAKFWYS